jgi:hypothetical protein
MRCALTGQFKVDLTCGLAGKKQAARFLDTSGG